MDDNTNTMQELPRITATVTHMGVVQMPGYDNTLMVNQDDILMELSAEIDKIRPKKDYNGKFAGRVTIYVEVWGDLETEATP